MDNLHQNENAHKTEITPGLQENNLQFIRGSTILTTHTVRQMKAYEIYENEMNSLSLLNGVTALFAAIGTGVIGFAVGQIVDLAKNASLQNPPAGITTVLCWMCFLIAAVCYIIAGVSYFMKKSQLNKIESECKTIEEINK